MKPVELSTLSKDSTLPLAVVKEGLPWVVQILDEGSPFGVTLTYEINLLEGGRPFQSPPITRLAHAELGSDVSYAGLIQIFDWLESRPLTVTFDIDLDEFPEGHPLPVNFCKKDSRYELDIYRKDEIHVRVMEGGKADLFLSTQIERAFQGSEVNESFIRDAFQWLENGFPTLWDHLLE